MNTGDVIQIDAPDFDPDIDKALPISTDQHTNDSGTQGWQRDMKEMLITLTGGTWLPIHQVSSKRPTL